MKKMTAVVMAVAACVAQAQVYVTPTGAGLEDGTSWADAMSFEAALLSGGELYLAGDTYISATASTFTVPAETSLYGAFTMNGDERDLEAHPSILHGNGQGIVVVTIGGADVVLDGIVITGAYGVSPVQGLNKSVNGNLTLIDCVISNNVMTAGIGSVLALAANFVNGHDDIIILRRCVIADNGRIIGPDTTHSSGSAANGIRSQNGTVIIEGSRFSRQFCDPWNSRSLGAGALFFDGRALRVSDTVFEENNSAPHGWGGGAVRLGGVAESATFSNCLFRANGFAYRSGMTPGMGGAIAIFNAGFSRIGFYQCTFVDNRIGDGNGGAVYMNSGAVTLRNCIFWNNTITQPGFDGAEIFMAGGSLDGDWLCMTSVEDPQAVRLGGHSLGSHVITDDPLFAADFRLKSQAGRWDPAIQDWVSDEVTSPCIDAGDPACDVGDEPAPHGGRINLGFDAGTAKASKSLMAEAPLVDILDPAFVDYTRWSLGGELTNSTLNAANVIIYYGTDEILEETAVGWDAAIVFPLPVSSESAFSTVTPFLKTDTDYYVRVYATNTFGEAWSDIKTFKTGSSLPEGWGVSGGEDIVHVRASAIGNNDGTDWYNAFTSIHDGIAALDETHTALWIAGGTYTLAMTAVISGDYDILGGFAGTETTPEARTRGANATVIRGGPFSFTLNVNSGALDNVTLTDFAVGPSFVRNGNGDFALSDFTFTNNVLPGSGGGFIVLNGGNVTMTRCTVSDNIARYWDLNDYGIRVNAGTSLAVFDSDISRNRGNVVWNVRGAHSFGISFRGTTLLVERTRFSENEICTHNAYGAPALYLAGSGSATIRNCLFDGNRVTWWRNEGNRGGHGSAVCVHMGGVLIENCTFAGNVTESVKDGDGAVYLRGGTLTLRNNIFWENLWGADDNIQYADLYVDVGTVDFGYNSFADEGSVMNAAVPEETTLFGDPLFIGDDCRLQSKEGYWDRATQSWKKAPNNSPCIDAGDPTDPVRDEPDPNGRRINLGAYGGTPFASKTQDFGTLLIVR